MKKESILMAIIGVLVGGLTMMVVASTAVNSQNATMMRFMGIGVSNGMSMGSSMNQMMGSMDDKSGYDFDKAFIDAMIVHHEGAIKMAQQAEHRAQHKEIKELSNNIIRTQTAEIEQMQAWKKAWMMQ